MNKKKLGENAYKTIINEWIAETAAERFLRIDECCLTGEKISRVFDIGPCSKVK